MPALEAFGRKWKIGSDDFVFPYVGSIAMRMIWFVLIGAIFLTYNNSYHCNDENLLKIYLFVLTGIHICLVIVEVIVVMISARGTISNSEPRKRIYIPLYIQLALFVLEFAWDVVGVVWIFDPSIDCHKSHSVLLLARSILVWNMMMSISVGIYLFLRIGLCRLPCCNKPPQRMRYETVLPSKTYDGRRLSSASSGQLVHHKRQRSWQWRLQSLFCWMTLKSDQQTAFADVSATLSEGFTYFRGYVPSDILAGIALLAMKQSESQPMEGEDSATRKPLDFQSKLVCKHFNRAVHNMKFAVSAYGYLAYLQRKGFAVGLFWLTDKFRCFCCQKKKVNSENENGINVYDWNIKTVKLVTGIDEKDILYASFKSEVFRPAFFVAFDHLQQAVVISIRGTLSLHDVLTDLSGEPSLLTTFEDGDVYGHKGMMGSAHAILLVLESEQILEKAFHLYQDYRLVIVGHSLGAAVASLLSIILKPKYPKLHCFAYSPPGCVINMEAVPYTRSFITSIIFGNDIVSRLSCESFESFSLKILDCMQTATIPKYRIMLDSFLYLIGCCRYWFQRKKHMMCTAELAIVNDPITINDFDANYEEEDIYDVVADAKLLRQTDNVTGKKRYTTRSKMALFVPGRIIHVYFGKAQTKCCGLFKKQTLVANWTAQSEFAELKLQHNMVKHHMPYTVLQYLRKLQTQNCTLD